MTSTRLARGVEFGIAGRQSAEAQDDGVARGLANGAGLEGERFGLRAAYVGLGVDPRSTSTPTMTRGWAVILAATRTQDEGRASRRVSATGGAMIVAQLTDTHVVGEGDTYFGHDTTRYLRDAIDALHALPALPDCVVVTGDLVNARSPAEYARFRAVMQHLRVPYFVVPGNHDDRDALRAVLPSASFGDARGDRIRYAIDDFEVRIVGLDANAGRRWPGGELDAATLAWLARILASAPQRPTLVCVHQPPFRTGLHYLDAFGFRGARRLRKIVERNPQVGRVVTGHIHCVRRTTWGAALVCSGPSTAPQFVPLVFMEGAVLGVQAQTPGFALHEWTPPGGFATTVFRRSGDAYVPAA